MSPESDAATGGGCSKKTLKTKKLGKKRKEKRFEIRIDARNKTRHWRIDKSDDFRKNTRAQNKTSAVICLRRGKFD